MKKKLFGALEGLDALDGEEPKVTELPDADDVKDDDKVFEETMAMVMEEEDEYNDEMDDLDDIYGEIDDIEEATERLEALIGSIEKYGISAPVMTMADPNGELVQSGVFGAYEELSDIPEKGEKADAAIEAAGALVATTGSALAAKAGISTIVGLSTAGIAAAVGVAATAASLVKLALMVKNTMQTRKKGLTALDSKLKAAGSLSDEVFGKKSAKAFTKAQYGDAIKAAQHVLKVVNSAELQKVADELSGIINGSGISNDKVEGIVKKADTILKSLDSDSNVKAILGLSVTFGEGSITASSKGATIKPTKGELGGMGWKVGDASGAIGDAVKLTTEAEAIAAHVKATADICKKAIDGLKKNLKKGKDTPIGERNAYKEAIVQVLAIVKANRAIANSAVSAIFKVNASAVAVAKAAISSKAKAEKKEEKKEEDK